MHKPDKHLFTWIILQILWITSLTISSVSTQDFDLNLITDSDLPPPKLTPSDIEVTLDHLMSYTVKCTAQYAVFWDKPHTDLDDDWKVEEVYEEDGSYSSVLTLNHVANKHVGNYMCRYKKYEHENIEDQIGLNWVSSVYVFVRDPDKSIVENVDFVISANQNSEAVIPCKPTHRDVQLKLTKGDDESQPIKFTYEPKIGFTVKVFSLSDGGTYLCSATEIGEEEHFELMVSTFTDDMSKPMIGAPNDDHAEIGKEYVLNCTVNIKQGVLWEAVWTGPNRQIITNNDHYIVDSPKNSEHVNEFGFREGVSRLTIRNVNAEQDKGIYKCQINDHSGRINHATKMINVLVPGHNYIKLYEPNAKYKVEVKAPKSIPTQWYAEYTSYPTLGPSNFQWYNNRNELIYPEIDPHLSSKFSITIKSNSIVMRVNNVALEDAGTYTLKAKIGSAEAEMKTELIVNVAPTVSFAQGKRMVDLHSREEVSLKCQSVGFPPSDMSWSFTQCSLNPVWPTCSLVRTAGTPTPIITSETNTQIMEINFRPSSPGILECHASNGVNSSSVKTEILVTDLKNSEKYLEINGLGTRKIAIGESVTLTCSALAYNYTSNLIWYRGGLPVAETENLLISENSTPYSFQKTLTWNKVGKDDAGVYECHASPIDGSPPKIIIVNVNVYDPIPPTLIQIENKEIEKEFSLGEPLRHECFFNGIPEPSIRWLKDGVLLQNNSRVYFTNDNNVLEITRIASSDDGVYTCEAINKVGSDSAQLTVKIKDKPASAVGKSWIIGALLVILLLIICTIILAIKIRRTRRRLRELKAAGLANFENGCIESLNPDMSLDEQADLLPYDKKYEFPRERLKLGKQLGSGAFGVVVKAEAAGIVAHEDSTTVAVKTVKPNADNEVMRALISELKIMIHMGQHLNVVNLLGAVTSNIAKREVLVIVEYCRYGNIQNFLQKHRSFFVDQINPETDEIDRTIETIEQREQRWSNDSGFEFNSQGLKYVKLSFSNEQLNKINSKGQPNRNSNQRGSHVNSQGYLRHSGLEYFPGGIDSFNTEKSLISSGKPESVCISNNSEQPAWRSNYKMDYNGPTPTINTSDLVCWGFQVARGMDYLSSRKVLHGDLAARNILLCDDNVVKICDFGLARSMYKCDNYKKKGESPLPFKWLAIESISDQVFSTYSDVWAFGIVMWELFSLAKTPYPGMKADQSLYMQLRDGYRMEKPNYANQELYDLMLNCWNARPESRPLFGQIEERLGKMLQLSVTEHYVDLNEPYMQVNADLFSDSNKDYIAILGPPTEMAPPVPIAHSLLSGMPIQSTDKNDPTNPSYLCMSPKSGNVAFSTQNGENNPKFQYPPASPTLLANLDNSQKLGRKKPVIPEEAPMLKNSGIYVNSDSESETAASPTDPKKPLKLKDLDMFDSSLKATNNYVNVPTAINKPKDAVSNPGYVTIGMGGSINDR